MRNTHNNLRWPDGRRIVTDRVFPNLPEVRGKPDWTWFVEDWDKGDPIGYYFQTEEDALADARMEIEEQQAELSCPDADQHNSYGCRTCGLSAVVDKEI